jgi:hypothetical protein
MYLLTHKTASKYGVEVGGGEGGGEGYLKKMLLGKNFEGDKLKKLGGRGVLLHLIP